MTIPIKIRILPGGRLPVKATPGAKGFDLYACIDKDTPGAIVERRPGLVERRYVLLVHPPTWHIDARVVRIPLGVAFEIPPGYEGQIRARSSLGAKGLVIPNGVGTIDSDYRGEVAALYLNLSGEDFVIRDGDRVAQIVFQKVPDVTLEQVDDLGDSQRGAGGFGSTGIREINPSKCPECDGLGEVNGGNYDGVMYPCSLCGVFSQPDLNESLSKCPIVFSDDAMPATQPDLFPDAPLGDPDE